MNKEIRNLIIEMKENSTRLENALMSLNALIVQNCPTEIWDEAEEIIVNTFRKEV